MKPIYELDEYGVLTNSEENYKFIARALKHDNSPVRKAGMFLFSWGDEKGTMLTILMGISPKIIFENKINFQHGVRFDDLFVSIIGTGSFGFEILGSDLHQNYIAEKLGLIAPSEELADLINGVRRYL